LSGAPARAARVMGAMMKMQKVDIRALEDAAAG
jgi:predicted 3-demethylubiquinone-9 3-methyltransferase (glyoxalase superfamily)